jgi:hypothetical protein
VIPASPLQARDLSVAIPCDPIFLLLVFVLSPDEAQHSAASPYLFFAFSADSTAPIRIHPTDTAFCSERTLQFSSAQQCVRNYRRSGLSAAVTSHSSQSHCTRCPQTRCNRSEKERDHDQHRLLKHSHPLVQTSTAC